MRSTRDGVFTTAQAQEGADIYAGMCVSCHQGMGNHVGKVFRESWGGYPLLELYTYIAYNMPKNDPGSLSADDNIRVIAYLLQLNGFPAGQTRLSADTLALQRIMLDTSVVK
jgi:mono/diheme cytochrome c family protein